MICTDEDAWLINTSYSYTFISTPRKPPCRLCYHLHHLQICKSFSRVLYCLKSFSASVEFMLDYTGLTAWRAQRWSDDLKGLLQNNRSSLMRWREMQLNLSRRNIMESKMKWLFLFWRTDSATLESKNQGKASGINNVELLNLIISS